MQSAGKPSLNRKRQILDHLVNEMEDQYWQIIELAVESSNLEDAKICINEIITKQSK